MPTTASSMGRGQITAIASTDARNLARPAPPATMITPITLTPTESGRLQVTPNTSTQKLVPSVKHPAKNTQTTPTRTATANATIAAQRLV